jgi:hypothetical protein
MPEMITLDYRADLLGNIQQALTGLQGFEVMALELIQNADDAHATSLTFDVRDEALVVRNNARFSNCGLSERTCPWDRDGDRDGARRPCNFHAISLMGARSKMHAGSQIGRFGIGFVSVYQITDEPIIRSAGVEMRLDPYEAKSATSPIPDAPFTEFELRWASIPSRTRVGLNASTTPENVAPLMVEALAGVMKRGLLFLRRLERVELYRNGALERSVKLVRADETLTVVAEPGGVSQAWRLVRRDARALAEERGLYRDYAALVDLDRSTEVQLAIPLGEEAIEGRLYAYLPTDQSSGLPLHINADFFPHSNRRAIVLDGRQHDRPWNEILLETAAAAIGESFFELRGALGHRRLWELGLAAFDMREEPAFKPFWEHFSAAASKTESVWTIKGEWRPASDALLATEALSTEQKVALADLGLDIIHDDLRSAYNALQTLGAKALRLPAVVDRLEALFTAEQAPSVAPVPLWQAIDYLGANLGANLGAPPFATAITDRLKAIPFASDVDGGRGALRDLWRTAEGVSASAVRSYIADCRFADAEILALGWLSARIGVYGFGDLARDLAKVIVTADDAKRLIGDTPADAERFYRLLTAFEADPADVAARQALSETPILRTGDGFQAPARVRMPGGFVDPIGHFDLMDASIVDERMGRLAKTVLGVGELTFRAYVEDHLEVILAKGPTPVQYIDLLTQIARYPARLDFDGGVQALSRVAFIRNRAGGWSRPSECYFWSAALEALLGEEGERWVDPAWMPTGLDGANLRDLLVVRLGMENRVSMADAVKRIESVVATQWPEPAVRVVNTLTRYVLERFGDLSTEQRVALRPLQTLKWLPASQDGTRLAEPMAPRQVYRSFRAGGFATQAPVIDLQVLRAASGRHLVDFLDFLDLPSEPLTEVVVAHLETCMGRGAPVQDVVYAILQERLLAGDTAAIDRLVGQACIYDAEQERYHPPYDVFWAQPPFGGRWRRATERMRTREALYSRLGVKEAPTADDYAKLLVEIGREAQVQPDDAAVHARCLHWLATALEAGDDWVEAVLDDVADHAVLLNLLDTPVLPSDAVWLDSEALATPFQGGLDTRLVKPPAVARATAARLFRALGCAPLSEVARLTLANLPDRRPDQAATATLHERADLLLWLAPTPDLNSALRTILSKVRVVSTDTLQVRSELFKSEPPVPSSPSAANAFLDGETYELHVCATPGGPTDWVAIFRAMFALLERHTHGLDVRPLVMTAAFVASLPTWEQARQALMASEFSAPAILVDELPAVEAIGDAAPDAEEEFGGVDDADQPDVVDDPKADDLVAGGEDDARPAIHDGDGSVPVAHEVRDDSTDHPGADLEIADPARADGEASGGGFEPRGGQEAFASRQSSGEFGAESSISTGQGSGASGREGWGNGSGGAWTGLRRVTRVDGDVRRSRMLAYVASETHERRDSDEDHSEDAAALADLSARIDAEAVAAVLDHERARGWAPEEQAHGNPGFDVLSTGPGGGRRVIEIKGLRADWTARGVKLSSVQFSMAQNYPDAYWLYVVENALEPERRRVTAVANPFSKVTEYWFDDGWRGVAEEPPQVQEQNLRPGRRVRHQTWGEGEIVEVHQGGVAVSATVDFGASEGRRRVMANAALTFLD